MKNPEIKIINNRWEYRRKRMMKLWEGQTWSKKEVKLFNQLRHNPYE